MFYVHRDKINLRREADKPAINLRKKKFGKNHKKRVIGWNFSRLRTQEMAAQ